jgi:hypothetical protein
MSNKLSSKIVIRDNVTPKGLLGYVFWLDAFMLTTKLLIPWNWLSPICILFIMINGGAVLLIWGIEKVSILKFSIKMMEILQSRELKLEDKIIAMTEFIHSSVGFLADMKMLQETEKKETSPPVPPEVIKE